MALNPIEQRAQSAADRIEAGKRAVAAIPWRIMGAVGLLMGFFVAVVIALVLTGNATHHLLTAHVGIASEQATGLAGLVVSGLVLLPATALLTKRHATRSWASLWAVIWIVLTLGLVSLDGVLSYQIITGVEALTAVGRAVAPLIGVLSVAASTTVLFSVRNVEADNDFNLGRVIGGILKTILVLTSSYGVFMLGMKQGLGAEFAFLLALIVETAFVWSMTMLRKHVAYKVAFLAFGLMLAFNAVETVGTLAGITTPFVQSVQQVGAATFVGSLGFVTLTVVLLTLAGAGEGKKSPAPTLLDPAAVRKTFDRWFNASPETRKQLGIAAQADDVKATVTEVIANKAEGAEARPIVTKSADAPKKRGRPRKADK